jgi:hypothetical protein
MVYIAQYLFLMLSQQSLSNQLLLPMQPLVAHIHPFPRHCNLSHQVQDPPISLAL